MISVGDEGFVASVAIMKPSDEDEDSVDVDEVVETDTVVDTEIETDSETE